MPTVSQGFDYQMPGKTDRCLSQKGLRIDGTIHRTVAPERLAGPGP
jgi:hypothetical protein